MGECSFGKGFGQTNPDLTEVENGVDERVWKSIPRSIFDGLAKRYQTVYVKKLFRQFGWDIKFDWPAEMITAIDAVVRRRSAAASGKHVERQDLLQHSRHHPSLFARPPIDPLCSGMSQECSKHTPLQAPRLGR